MMNWVAVVILLTLIASFFLDLIADILNIRGLRKELPDEFEDVYDPDRYRRSQEYLKATTRFGWAAGAVDLAALLVFWFAGGFAILDEWVRSFGWGPVASGLVFMGVLLLLKALLSLPLSVYSTFVIEERFGFNKTTPKTFVLDRIKGLALSLVLGAPLLAAILAFFEYAGGYAWLWCWLIAAIYLLTVQFIAPRWIMPIFNKFEPLEEGELRSSIMDYADKVDFSLQNVYVMDGSKRSAKSNAFFTGFGKNKRIALFDTLIDRHTVRELTAVLAHEIGHYKKNHIVQGMIIGILHMGVMFFLLSLFLSYEPLFAAFYIDTPSVYAGLIFFGLLFAPIDLFLGILLQMRSRKNEYQADRFAVRTTRDPQSMISALKKLAADNLSNLTPHPFYVVLHYSHPPMPARVKAIRAVGKPLEGKPN
ncbi:MAG: M48 family metallopeptidase [Thermodesulfobacteriota bacterium]